MSSHLTRHLSATALLIALAACGGETVDVGNGNNSPSNNNTNQNNSQQNNSPANNPVNNNPANNNPANNSAANSTPGCTETTLYPDDDGDGFGGDGPTTQRCLTAGESVAGYSRSGGDCDDTEAWINPGVDEVCGDFQDENCALVDDTCPTTRTADLDEPTWACDGAPPSNVLAWARYPDGGGYFRDGGCFMIFEGLPGEFYVKRRLERASADPGCDTTNGCVCPSLNGWPSYDRRLYAFLLASAPETCEEISILDHGGESQPVSNACRKYFYQMHYPGQDLPLSFFAAGESTARRRLSDFPTIEVACAEDAPHANLPFQSLLTAPVEINPGFTAK